MTCSTIRSEFFRNIIKSEQGFCWYAMKNANRLQLHRYFRSFKLISWFGMFLPYLTLFSVVFRKFSEKPLRISKSVEWNFWTSIWMAHGQKKKKHHCQYASLSVSESEIPGKIENVGNLTPPLELGCFIRARKYQSPDAGTEYDIFHERFDRLRYSFTILPENNIEWEKNVIKHLEKTMRYDTGTNISYRVIHVICRDFSQNVVVLSHK